MKYLLVCIFGEVLCGGVLAVLEALGWGEFGGLIQGIRRKVCEKA